MCEYFLGQQGRCTYLEIQKFYKTDGRITLYNSKERGKTERECGKIEESAARLQGAELWICISDISDQCFLQFEFCDTAPCSTPSSQICTMQTSLPDLPFTNYGDTVLDASGIRSASKSSPRTYPRTDLQTLTPWTSFPSDIHQAVLSATTHAHLLPTPFDINSWTQDMVVENEESIRSHARFALHNAVEVVLRRLGVEGRFTMPGGGNTAIVGDPDFSWVMALGEQPHPKVIVRVSVTTCVLLKTRWCRLSTKLGGRRIWRILSLPLMALIVMP